MKYNFKQKNNLSVLVAFIFGLSLSSFLLGGLGETVAYFNDIEESSGNEFSAGLLDFSITNNSINEFIGTAIGEDVSFPSVLVSQTGSLPIQYTTNTVIMGGSAVFCNEIDLETFHLSGFYDGKLPLFNNPSTNILGTRSFELSLNPFTSNIPHGEECNIDIVFDGWRDGISEIDSGFTDEERIELRLTSRMIVLNEFLPNPDGEAYGFDFGSDSDDMPQGEWVEIYNNSDYDYDVDGWYIWDASSYETNKIYVTTSNTIPATTVIGAHDWLVVYMNKSVLNNTGDTVKLYDATNRLVDSYAYGNADFCELEPTPDDSNSISVSGSCSSVPPNKSYARIPDGIGSWVDPVPTPGNMNTEDDVEGVELFTAFVETLYEVMQMDTEAPEIQILGNNPAYIPLDSTYNDLGALVTDNVDDNLGIEVTGNVITESIGEYEVVYTAMDGSGNVGTATRTVIVYDPEVGVPSPQVTNEVILEPEPVTPSVVIVEEPVVVEVIVEEEISPEVIVEDIEPVEVIEEIIVIEEESVIMEDIQIVEEVSTTTPIIEEEIIEILIEEVVEVATTTLVIVEEIIIEEEVIIEPMEEIIIEEEVIIKEEIVIEDVPVIKEEEIIIEEQHEA